MTAERQDARPSRPTEEPRRRALLAEDDELVMEVLHAQLTTLDFDVTGAASGTRALDIFRARPSAFDVLVSDVSMPGLNGLELARACRDIAPSLPVLFVTGYAQGDVRRELEALAGATELLEKPFTTGELRGALDRVLFSGSAGVDEG